MSSRKGKVGRYYRVDINRLKEAITVLRELADGLERDIEAGERVEKLTKEA